MTLVEITYELQSPLSEDQLREIKQLQRDLADAKRQTEAAQTLTAGVVSGVITLQLQDAANHAVTMKAAAEPFVVNLSTNSVSALAEFRDSATGLVKITSLTFTPGVSSLSFKYFDTKLGKPTLTATAAFYQHHFFAIIGNIT